MEKFDKYEECENLSVYLVLFSICFRIATENRLIFFKTTSAASPTDQLIEDTIKLKFKTEDQDQELDLNIVDLNKLTVCQTLSATKHQISENHNNLESSYSNIQLSGELLIKETTSFDEQEWPDSKHKETAESSDIKDQHNDNTNINDNILDNSQKQNTQNQRDLVDPDLEVQE